MKELTPANIVVQALRGMGWRDFQDFDLPEDQHEQVNTQAGVRMAGKLADAIEKGQAAVLVGAGVDLS